MSGAENSLGAKNRGLFNSAICNEKQELKKQSEKCHHEYELSLNKTVKHLLSDEHI